MKNRENHYFGLEQFPSQGSSLQIGLEQMGTLQIKDFTV
jgi:hypothetical protein